MNPLNEIIPNKNIWTLNLFFYGDNNNINQNEKVAIQDNDFLLALYRIYQNNNHIVNKDISGYWGLIYLKLKDHFENGWACYAKYQKLKEEVF